MAVKRVGMRKIVVDGVEYLWTFPRRRDHRDPDCRGGCHALVCHPSRRGSMLSVGFPQHHPGVAPGLFPVVPVLPSQIAAAICRAVSAGWVAGSDVPLFRMSGVVSDAEPGAATNGESQ